MGRHSSAAITGCCIACAVFATLHFCRPGSTQHAELSGSAIAADGKSASVVRHTGNPAAATAPEPRLSPAAVPNRNLPVRTAGFVPQPSPAAAAAADGELTNVDIRIHSPGSQSGAVEKTINFSNGVASYFIFTARNSSTDPFPPVNLTFSRSSDNVSLQAAGSASGFSVNGAVASISAEGRYELKVSSTGNGTDSSATIAIHVVEAEFQRGGYSAGYDALMRISETRLDGRPIAVGAPVASVGSNGSDPSLPSASVEMTIEASDILNAPTLTVSPAADSETLSGNVATARIMSVGEYTFGLEAQFKSDPLLVTPTGIRDSPITITASRDLRIIPSTEAAQLQPRIDRLTQQIPDGASGEIVLAADAQQIAAAPWLIIGSGITAHTSPGAANRQYQTVIDDVPGSASANQSRPLDAARLLTPGAHRIAVQDSFLRAEGRSPSLTVMSPDLSVGRPRISGISQDAGTSRQELSISGNTTRVTGSRFRVTVIGDPGVQMELWFLKPTDSPTTFSAASVETLRPATVTNSLYEFDIRDTAGFAPGRAGYLIAVARSGSRHNMSVPLRVESIRNEVDRVTIGNVAVRFKDASGNSVDAIDGRTITGTEAELVVSDVSGIDEGDTIQVLRGGAVLARTGIESASAQEYIAEVSGLRLGTNKLTVQVFRAGLGSSKGVKAVEVVVLADQGMSTLTQRVGLPETTGPPVDYTEFTTPRAIIDGFNPSDKVVTRVARLYYFRDAHRVTQIINRRAQSYNAESATMARQLADKARAFAEQTVDSRRAAERSAIEAAGYAREAENAIRQYQDELRRAENEVQQLENQERLIEDRIRQLRADAAAADSRTTEADIEQAQADLTQVQDRLIRAEQDASLFRQQAQAAVTAVNQLRRRELEERERMNQEQAKEDRAVADQFRLEVRAAHEDPDTYAAGIPDSDDPVAQVTLSVIGEGLIQMRGPLKGVNIIHTMINQIDSPVGQVRVGIHTVQVNGEDGNRMEEVVGRISRYVDHSRFLTSQSAQILRNAVAVVASRKAQQVGLICQPAELILDEHGLPLDQTSVIPPEGLVGPAVYDEHTATQRYQEAFFGREFIAELRSMDSEFVRAGNKLLSLHSMDTTSLASSLFMLALAGNDTRMEILQEFEAQLMCKLPQDEIEYFHASDTKERYHFRKFQFMADNARFVSLRGFHDAGIIGNGTLNPVQREFIKLAQILKSRLITEVELKQRVIERALIEERVGNYEEQLRQARKKELLANQQLAETRREYNVQIQTVARQIPKLADAFSSANAKLRAELRQRFNDNISDAFDGLQVLPTSALPTSLTNEQQQKIQEEIRTTTARVISVLKDDSQSVGERRRQLVEAIATATYSVNRTAGLTPNMNATHEITLQLDGNAARIEFDPQRNHRARVVSGQTAFRDVVEKWTSDMTESPKWLLIDPKGRAQIEALFDASRVDLAERNPDALEVLFSMVEAMDLFKEGVLAATRENQQEQKEELEQILNTLLIAGQAAIAGDTQAASKELRAAHSRWTELRRQLPDTNTQSVSQETDAAFSQLLVVDLQFQFVAASAEAARRPLDHKKFLDMLIDETEEKYIELVEGTRAHTAVIDDYVKRICTALDDDFNTQFYEPAFRRIREETYACRGVSLGQIEHTTVLTNNREFAKVEPQATMEFDLPRRRIMIAEAMQAAQAAYDDYGALLNDPAFLALTKLNSGQPAAPVYGTDAFGNPVRNVLPGLPSQSGEAAVIQAQTGQPKFQSQLEALIPDPAVYKFETGTGYEIRPVIQPDGQSVVFDFNYMYTTNVREPVRADEKHLGRVKRHFIDTDVQIGNYELREVSRYRVALKASRTGRGVPLLEDVPIAGALFRPQASEESSLQQNIILANSVIFPTMFDLMGLRWAPAVADLNVDDIKEQEFTYRNRMRQLKDEVYDYGSTQVDEFLRIPEGERRPDLYRTQQDIPLQHPNGYIGPGNDRQDAVLREGYSPPAMPGFRPHRAGAHSDSAPLIEVPPTTRDSGLVQPQSYTVPSQAPRDQSLRGVQRLQIPSGADTRQPLLRPAEPTRRNTQSQPNRRPSPTPGVVTPAAFEQPRSEGASPAAAGRATLNSTSSEDNSGRPSRRWGMRLPFRR